MLTNERFDEIQRANELRKTQTVYAYFTEEEWELIVYGLRLARNPLSEGSLSRNKINVLLSKCPSKFL